VARLPIGEVVPDKLYALGGTIPLDGRVHWAPGESGFTALNCYLLKEGDAAMVIDPGPLSHEDVLLEQLAELVPPGSPISVFLTRAELDCFAALGAIMREYKVERLLAGGGHNPFDQFDYVGGVGPARRGDYVKTARLQTGAGFDLGNGRELVIVIPGFRLLATFWAYDTATKALFTSDVFTHGRGETEVEARQLSRRADSSDDEVAEHLTAKFWWLRYGKLEKLRGDLRSIFSTWDVEAICAGHGKPIVGKEAVDASVDQLIRVLEQIEDTAEDLGSEFTLDFRSKVLR
jgi:flavorubredoxin